MTGTLPFRLSLLFAMPTTREALKATARRDPPSDYLGAALQRSSVEKVWASYEAIAKAADALAKDATALGAEVVLDARLADLEAATRTSEVVILCAHWRGETVTSTDLARGPTGFADTLQAATGLEGRVLRKALGLLLHPPSEAADLKDWRRDVTRALNRLIHKNAFAPKSFWPLGRRRAACIPGEARALIDQALASHIHPGNQLELTDGLFDAGTVEAAIAPDFGGELDLSVCHAVYLARFIGKRRSGSVPRPLLHHGTKLLQPLPRFAILQDTLRLCAETGLAYFRARTQVEAELLNTFGDLIKDKQRNTRWAWPQP